jgi:hypothetical protein
MWAIHDLHSFGLTRCQEPNDLHIHHDYLLQVQKKRRSVILKLLVQFGDVLRLKVTTQMNRRLPATRGLFDLHVPVTLIENVGANANASAVPTKLTGFTGLLAPKNC